jgi:hypothetical protein
VAVNKLLCALLRGVVIRTMKDDGFNDVAI